MNNPVPDCRECKWSFLPEKEQVVPGGPLDLACDHVTNRTEHPFMDHIEYGFPYCKDARLEGQPCGPSGSLFEERDGMSERGFRLSADIFVGCDDKWVAVLFRHPKDGGSGKEVWRKSGMRTEHNAETAMEAAYQRLIAQPTTEEGKPRADG